jgi:hypothetical protein
LYKEESKPFYQEEIRSSYDPEILKPIYKEI